MKVAPRLSTCSFATERTSLAETMAPSRRHPDKPRPALRAPRLAPPRLAAEGGALPLQQDIGPVDRCCRIGGDRAPRRSKRVVGEGGVGAGAALCGDFEPHLDHALD